MNPEESARFEQIRARLPGYAGSLEGAYADVFFLFRLVERLESGKEQVEMRLTPERVRAAVEHIRAISGDAESAHNEEDELYRVVLQAIADRSCAAPEECARLALETAGIDFPRWCA
jgi:hypothetical protein